MQPHQTTAIDEFDPARRAAFLGAKGWTLISPVGSDGAQRRYFRVRRDGGRTAVLMESYHDGAPQATPGHGQADFIRIGKYLREAGFHVPEVYEFDAAAGLMLLEDMGDVSFRAALESGLPPADLYGLATDILRDLRSLRPSIDLPRFYANQVYIARRRVVDWYLPLVRREKNADGLAESYLGAWSMVEDSLPPCPQGFLHVDFHVENLMWLPHERGKWRCGVLDFQAAMTGPVPYDLGNLVENARMDIPHELRAAMLDRYCAGLAQGEVQGIRLWYRVLATQFHCKVIGQFIRLALRGSGGVPGPGNPRYLEHLPRLAAYIRTALQDPVLRPVKRWFDNENLDFQVIPDINSESLQFIRNDAF